jgi:acetyl-CoA synthetase
VTVARSLTPHASRYEDCVAGFRWPDAPRFNMAWAVCDRHAQSSPDAPAIITVGDRGVSELSFLALQRGANRLANVLQALGVVPGDAVAIHLPQCPQTAIAHVACYKLGAVALPLFSLFGPDALTHRLRDSGAIALITNVDNLTRLAGARQDLSDLRHVLCIDGEDDGARPLDPLLQQASDRFVTRDTLADDPALLIYTSGTTGPPKGALHGHRCLIGHLPGVELPHRFFPQPGDRQWTPADWAWIGGLMDVLMPTLYHGLPVVAQAAGRFDPEAAFALMARTGVRNAFLPPTALRMMRQVVEPARFGHSLRSVASGGESLGEEMIAWGREAFGLTISEFYGQTEVNLVVGNSPDLFPVRPGSMGRPIPGHTVAVIDDDGQPLPPGEEGSIAVRRPDPAMFIEYWRHPQATREKFIGEWCVLGDLGHVDEQGYFWFKSRSDDVIMSAGYRIGPTEVEECLLRHPDVALAGVIGAPDPLRGEVVTAYVVPVPGADRSADAARALSEFVRQHLSAHEYPRRVRFIDEMPLTVTGKLRRNALREMERERTD